MHRDEFDIESAGEPAPTVDYTRSQPLRPAAALALFGTTVALASVGIWEFTGWLAGVIA